MSLHDTPTHNAFFPLFGLPATEYKVEVLRALGKAMATPIIGWVNEEMPAGYIYLGQFIVHDISRLARGVDHPVGVRVDLDSLRQLRSAALDLDSVYGEGFEDTRVAIDRDSGELLMRADGRDLCRDKQGQALIADDRNDENLLVAQLHLQFLKLHNYFLGQLRKRQPGKTAKQLYELAREQLQLHYQEVVVFDFLRRVLDPLVWEYVVFNNQGSVWQPRKVEAGRVPVELSAAALRFGHSMVNHFYLVSDKLQSVDLQAMFDWTGSRKLGDGTKLPDELHVDWNLFFYDLGQANRPKHLNLARKILPFVTLSRNEAENHGFEIAENNLLRGNEMGSPHAQAIIAHLQAEFPGLSKAVNLKALSPQEILRGSPDYPDLPSKLPYADDLAQMTPLWFYILQEAWQQQGGLRLGTLGSLVVAESLRALVFLSEPSIYNEPQWKSEYITPTLEYSGARYLQMSDLLAVV